MWRFKQIYTVICYSECFQLLLYVDWTWIKWYTNFCSNHQNLWETRNTRITIVCFVKHLILARVLIVMPVTFSRVDLTFIRFQARNTLEMSKVDWSKVMWGEGDNEKICLRYVVCCALQLARSVCCLFQ